MVDYGGFPRRISLLILLILTWTMLLNSASSFSLGNSLEGVIEGIIALGLIGVLIDGRAVRALEARKVKAPRAAILILVLMSFVVVYGEVPQLFQSEVSVLGELYLPGLLSLVQSVGSLILALLFIWETVRLAMRRST